MPGKKSKRIMRRFRIDEISGVDRPAQKGALALLMKRAGADSVEELVKRGEAALTTVTDDHTHLLSFYDYDNLPKVSGTTSWAGEKPRSPGHSHPWIVQEDGTIVIGEVNGHTHDIDVMSKAEIAKRFANVAMHGGRYPIRSVGDLDTVVRAFDKAGSDRPELAAHIAKRADALKLTDKLPTSGELAEAISKYRLAADSGKPTGGLDMPGEAELQKKLDETNNKVTKMAAMIAGLMALSADGVAYAKSLSETDREAFFEKSAQEQTREIDAFLEKQQDKNPVVFTAKDGTEYRKSDDERLIKMAKDRDADREALQKAERAREDSEFAKRAETEMGNLTGETTMKVAVIRAIEKGEAIENEEIRKAALEMLKGADAAVRLGKSFGRGEHSLQQHADPGSAADANAELHKRATEYAKEHDITEAAAYDAIMKTDEGAELYRKSLGSAAPPQTH